MNAFITLVFQTSGDKDLNIRITDADENVTLESVNTSMQGIVTANAIAGIDNIVSKKAASLFTINRKIFNVA